jgi:hypothetical protein
MNQQQTYPTTRNERAIHQPGERLRPTADVVEYFRRYARERPEVVALWCLGTGFVLGWKLKIW